MAMATEWQSKLLLKLLRRYNELTDSFISFLLFTFTIELMKVCDYESDEGRFFSI